MKYTLIAYQNTKFKNRCHPAAQPVDRGIQQKPNHFWIPRSSRGMTTHNYICCLIFITLTFIANIAFAKPIINIHHWQTNNKVPVYFVQTTRSPILDVRVLFNAGSAKDNNLYGIANLTGTMLNEGTNQLNNNQIAEKFDEIGTQFNISINRDISILSLRCLTKNNLLIPSIELLNSIITNPSFPAKELKRLKQQITTEIAADQQLPAIVATQTFYQTLYGNSPYAHTIMGTKKTVQMIRRSDIVKFYQQYYSTKNMMIILVGNISKNTASLLANKITANLPAGIKHIPAPQAQPITKNLIKSIAFPGTQSYIRIGCLGINYNDPNLFPVLIGNYILGSGVFVSRLFSEVRQKHGLSYSVKSELIFLKNRGPFYILLQTKNQSKNKALQIAKLVLNNFIQSGPTQQELKDAKKFLLGNFALQLSNNDKIANIISTIAFYNLPIDYLDTYAQKVQTITTQDVKKSFQSIIGTQ
ncbi:MAG: pitrilysin family protein, partial [Gammaproteobacteria bacterium]